MSNQNLIKDKDDRLLVNAEVKMRIPHDKRRHPALDFLEVGAEIEAYNLLRRRSVDYFEAGSLTTLYVREE
jgi:hypothetical protein